MMLDLKKDYRQTLCQIAKESFTTPIEIWAYGSRVNGDNHDASDLDLVIRPLGLTGVDSGQLLAFRKKIQLSNIPILVQILNWQSLPENFCQNIKKKHEIVYTSSCENFE